MIIKKWSSEALYIFLTAVVVVFIPIASVSAFSLISLSFMSGNSVIKGEKVEMEKVYKPQNSQNIQLLQPAIHSDPNPAKGGGDITVIDDTAILAESGVSGTVVDINGSQNNGRISAYEVHEGDSLSQIAEMFGVSANTIRWANSLEGPIQPGQTLVILPISGVRHVVKSGGTIKDIAKIYEADEQEIALFNGIDVDTELKPGDEIIVPSAELPQKEEKSSGKSTVLVKGSTKTTSNISYQGYYTNPLPGSVITQYLHGYNGVDFGAPVGTPIYAAASGVVITSKDGGWNGGYGSFVVISHDNGTQTLYSHMSSNSVYVGQKIETGDVVGYVGLTGKTTGPHLHFEVRGAKNPWGGK